MSSILTALKKLEDNDFHKEDVGILSGKTSFRHKKNFRTFAGSSPLTSHLLVSILVLVFILVAGIMAWRYHEIKKSVFIAQKQAADSGPAVILPAKPAIKTNEKKIPENQVKSHIQIPVSNATIPESRPAKPRSNTDITKANILKTPIAKSSVPKILKKTPVVVAKPKQKAPIKPKPVPGPTPVAAPLPLPEETSPPAVFDIVNTTPPSGHEIITLQAIAWAVEPESRMAVINGKIVRQGNTLNGTVIHQINENDVVFKKGSYIWKMLFKVR